jgi:hypothetical protein
MNKPLSTWSLEEIENRLKQLEPEVALNHKRQALQSKDFDVAPILEKSRLTKRANELRSKAKREALQADLIAKTEEAAKKRADLKSLIKRFPPKF